MPYRPTYVTLLSPYFNLSVYGPICKLRKSWLFEIRLVDTEVLFFCLLKIGSEMSWKSGKHGDELGTPLFHYLLSRHTFISTVYTCYLSAFQDVWQY